jgi:ATP/maltotriose-dependent transcriptional regulator MalT
MVYWDICKEDTKFTRVACLSSNEMEQWQSFLLDQCNEAGEQVGALGGRTLRDPDQPRDLIVIMIWTQGSHPQFPFGPHKAQLERVPGPTSLLTQREVEVLQGIAAGMSNQEIAAELVITPSTVKWYVSRIYKKLDVRSRIQAVTRARELNVLR